jgi:hypothetical protein
MRCSTSPPRLRRTASHHKLSDEHEPEVVYGKVGGGDPAVTLANASAYLEALGHGMDAWIWLEQSLAVGLEQGEFYDGKRQAARVFYRWELPKVGAQLDLLDSPDTTVLDVQPGWF